MRPDGPTGSEVIAPVLSVVRKLVLLAIPVVALSSAAAMWWGLPWWRERQLIHQARSVEAALEIYRQRDGRHPGSLAEAGIAEPAELCYRREGDGSYILWFGTTLGKSAAFHSDEHRWR